MSIKVSIIVPVYNVEDYLSQCLDSIINQSIKEIEIICVDDGSTDGSSYLLEEYSKKDERIKIYTQSNSGQGSARNLGIKMSNGEYILFVDADDKILPELLEKTYLKAKKLNLELIFFQLHAFEDLTNKPLNRYNDNYYSLTMFSNEFDNKIFNFKDTNDFIFDIPVSPCNKLYKTKFLKEVNAYFPEGLFFEDNVFFFRTYLNAKKVFLIREPYYLRRVREFSTTTIHDERLFDFFEILDIIKNIFIEKNIFNDYKEQYINFYVKSLIKQFLEIKNKNINDYFISIKERFGRFSTKEINLLSKTNKIHYNNVMISESYKKLEFLEKNKTYNLYLKSNDKFLFKIKYNLKFIFFLIKTKLGLY